MSTNRDKALDIANTKEQIEKRAEPTGRTNWLGHIVGKGSAALDAMLLDGATMEQLRTTRGAIYECFRHYKVEHGLPVIKRGDKYMFDRDAL